MATIEVHPDDGPQLWYTDGAQAIRVDSPDGPIPHGTRQVIRACIDQATANLNQQAHAEAKRAYQQGIPHPVLAQ